MNTKAVRIYGVKDLRLEEFELPTMRDDEIEARIVTDSLCMSTYKVSNQGEKHKKLPNDLKNHPVIMGHEFCGVITKVGEKWKHLYKPGDCFVAQPNLGRADTFSLGYSFPYVGGEATNVVIMNEAIEKGCLLPYKGEGFFEGALVEPLSCIVAGFKANFHLRDRNDYDHTMGIKENGALAILGGTGPMGFLAIDYAIHNDRRPKHLVVTGRTQSKLDMAKRLYPVEEAAKYGVTLTYVLTADEDDIVEELKALTPDAKGFDDIFLMAAKERLVTQAEQLLAYDGCLNFFAGPADSKFASTINFYNIHYNATHFVGTSGSNTQDMKDAIALIENKTVNVAKIATHIMGLNHVCESILNLPKMPGGKKIVYSGKEFPVTDVSAFGENNELEKHLKELVDAHDGLWNAEAEQYFLEHAKDI
ncbi:MAG: L-sorbose 1-phosphate reductase [Roseburia sp. 40_7]|jgi:threonine dehydrogenase-like Zn-dependent dehydrogenase|nr:MAG: L-sorbose 1-phosphate reductase [Roseburia sp. 40_7]